MAREIVIPKTVDELMAKVVEMSGIDSTTVPHGRGFCWFGNADESGMVGPPMIFKWGERSPFNKRMGIVAMFHNEVEARVYAVPLEKPEKNEEIAFTRHTLSKSAPTFFFEVLPFDVFQAEIADELKVLADETARPDSFGEDEEEGDLKQEPETAERAAAENKDEAATEETGALET
jgi:hypothetical protein